MVLFSSHTSAFSTWFISKMFVQCPICLPNYICIKVGVSCVLSHRHCWWGLASHKSFCLTRDNVNNTVKNPYHSFLLIPPQFGPALSHSCNFIYRYTCCIPLPLAHLSLHPFTWLVSSMLLKMDIIYDSIQLSIHSTANIIGAWTMCQRLCQVLET